MATLAPFLPLLLLLVTGKSLALSPRQDSGGGETIMYEMFHIESTIVARYATTRITSVVLNDASISQELSFQIQLPETGFISSFSM